MAFESKCTPRRRCRRPGKFSKVHEYKNLWYRSDPALRYKLWEKYDYDREKYMLDYQPDDEDYKFFQELGMQTFVRMERRLRRWSRLDPYYDAGKLAMRSLGTALAGNTPDENRPNIIFVFMDFEGDPWDSHYGVTEFGFAAVDSKQLLSQNEARIVARNFTLKNRRKRKFMFGNTTRLSLEILGRTFASEMIRLVGEDSQCEVILVGHSVLSEIRTLDYLGIPLEELPVTGILDTCFLAKKIIGRNGSLKCLLNTLNIPNQPLLLHCAGNDAHYALQALLALIQVQCHDSFGQLEKLARHESPSQPYPVEREVEGDWADDLELDACLFTFDEVPAPDDRYDIMTESDEPSEVTSCEGGPVISRLQDVLKMDEDCGDVVRIKESGGVLSIEDGG